MSLINDALRKARQAASEHEARSPEGPFQARKAYPSRSPNRRTGVVLVASVAVAAGLLGAALAWWLTVDRQSQSITGEIPQQRPIAAEPIPTPPEEEADKEGVDAVSPAGAQMNPGEGSQQPAPEYPATQSEETTDPSVATATPAPLIAQSLPKTIQPSDSIAAGVSDEERVFVLDAELGYATLKLGYIVARSTNPFAEINGTEVRIGSEIEGFVVESIEADRVTLRDDRGLLILRVP